MHVDCETGYTSPLRIIKPDNQRHLILAYHIQNPIQAFIPHPRNRRHITRQTVYTSHLSTTKKDHQRLPTLTYPMQNILQASMPHPRS